MGQPIHVARFLVSSACCLLHLDSVACQLAHHCPLSFSSLYLFSGSTLAGSSSYLIKVYSHVHFPHRVTDAAE